MGPEIIRYAGTYAEAKVALGSALGLSADLLRVHIGLAIFVLSALVTGRRMRSWRRLATVAAFAVANEIVAFYSPGPSSDALSALDLLNTLIWPVALFLLARRGKTGPVKVQ